MEGDVVKAREVLSRNSFVGAEVVLYESGKGFSSKSIGSADYAAAQAGTAAVGR